MLNKISSKFRRWSSSGNGNSGQDKSFAYGRMGKQDDAYEPSQNIVQSQKYESAQWKSSDDHEKEEDSTISFAESIFPIDDENDHMRNSKPFGGYSSEEDDISLEQESKKSFARSMEEEDSGKSFTRTLEEEEESRKSSARSLEEESKKNLTASFVADDIYAGPGVLANFEDAEDKFLNDYEDYFQNLAVDNFRKENYPKLDLQRLVYLDYANCGLFSSFQVEEHMRVLLEETPYLGLASLSETDTGVEHLSAYIRDAQERILSLLNTDHTVYCVIFTTGLSSGFGLIGESYPFQRNTPLLVSQDNHEAVRKLIIPATQKGAKSILVPVGDSDLKLNTTELRKILRRHGGQVGNGGLLVFPLQSCASGVVHSVNWVAAAQQNGFHVAVDASTYLPAGSLDLSLNQPEFVIGSFSHLLGYPSGIGFVLVCQKAFTVQSEQVRDGITLIRSSASIISGRDCHILAADRTLDFPSIAAVSFGLIHLQNAGLEAIQKRVKSLVAWLLLSLISLRHKGGQALVQVYGGRNPNDRGNIVAFNVLDSTGSHLPPTLVQKLAGKTHMVMSAGYGASPGLATVLKKSSQSSKDVSVFDQPSSFHFVRVSLGPITTFLDVYRLVQFISRFQDDDYSANEAIDYMEETQ